MIASRQAGFSLVEAMVAMAIFTVVVVAATSLLVSGATTQRMAMARGDLQARARLALMPVCRELRQSRAGKIVVTAENGCDRVDFSVVTEFDEATGEPLWSTPISYRYVPATVDADGNGIPDWGTLIRTQDGEDRPAARRVAPGGFDIELVGSSIVLTLRLSGLGPVGRPIAALATTRVLLVN